MFGVRITWPYVLFVLVVTVSLSYGADIGTETNDALLRRIRVYGSIGMMPEFDTHGEWPIYQDRLEQYFAANMIEPERRVAVLLTSIGDQTYKILRDICDPYTPSSKSYDELTSILNNQFSPRKSVFRSRIIFYSLMQTPNETINDWYIRIKSYAVPCKFGNALDYIVKDKLVSGLLRGPIQDKLCEEDHEKTTNELLEIALVKEANLKPIEVDDNKNSDKRKHKTNRVQVMNGGICFSCGKKLLQTNYSKRHEMVGHNLISELSTNQFNMDYMQNVVNDDDVDDDDEEEDVD